MAKADGDKHLAAAIHRFNKPSAPAWLANQLMRAHRDDVQAFVDLGAALREATAMLNGNRLRELGKQKHQLVSALVKQARALADSTGHKVSQSTAHGLEDALNADRAETAVREAASLVSKLRADLDEAQTEHSRREQEHRTSRARMEQADRAGREAARRLAGAVQRRQSPGASRRGR